MSLVTRVRQLAVRTVSGMLRGAIRLGSRGRAPRLIVCYAWPDFARKAEALTDLLQRGGFHPTLRALSPTSFMDRVRVQASRDLWIGFWNEFRTDYLPDNYYFFNAEPLHRPHWQNDAAWFRGMRGALEVWDYSLANRDFVTPLGVPFRYVPFGYAAWYETMFQRNTTGKALTEDIDVLFFGTMSARRAAVLDAIEARGFVVYRATPDRPARGAALDELLMRSRIVVQIYCFDDPTSHLADYARLDHLLSNGRFVIHEALGPDNPDPAFEAHVITRPHAELADVCLEYLERPEARHAQAERGHRWFREERDMAKSLPFDELAAQLARLARD